MPLVPRSRLRTRTITAHKYVCLPGRTGWAPTKITTISRTTEEHDERKTLSKSPTPKNTMDCAGHTVLCTLYFAYSAFSHEKCAECLGITFHFSCGNLVRSVDRLIDLYRTREISFKEISLSSRASYWEHLRYANEYTTGGLVKHAHEKRRAIQFRAAAFTELFTELHEYCCSIHEVKRHIA